MISVKTACEEIRKLPDVAEKDHFGSDAFYANKRIFATVWPDEAKVNVRLTEDLQRKFLELDGEAFSAIENAWGRQGWTSIQLKFIDRKLFLDAIKLAWEFSGLSARNQNTSKKTKKSPTSSGRKSK